MSVRLFLFSCMSVLCLAASAQTGTPAGSPSPQTSPAAKPRGCSPLLTKPSAADTLLARGSYKEAEVSYRALLAQQPGSQEARLGITRALIGEDKVYEARGEADGMLVDEPLSALAEIAITEADYRAADVDGAYMHARTAAQDDPCEGRASEDLASLLELNGNYARAAGLLGLAHRLRPTDELIRRDWIDSLPRAQRKLELTGYLAGEHSLSPGAAKDYDNALQYLKAYQPGECRVRSKAETTSVKMQPVQSDSSRRQSWGLDTYFDGKKHRMQIDTGASGIVLTESAVRDLKLTPEYKIKTGGVGDEGERDSYLTHVHSIRIGDVEISDCMVEVVQKSQLDVDGLIGMDVFRRWLVTLDYIHSQVRLAPLPAPPPEAATARLDSDPMPSGVGDEDDRPHDRYIAPEMKSWLPIFRIGHDILLQSRIKEGAVHYLIMDTGADITSLSLPMAREAGKLHEAEDMAFTGLSGKVKKVYETGNIPLRVENVILPERGYFAFDLTSTSHDAGFEVSGLLGLPTLQRLTITIDYRDDLLRLDYDPKLDRQRF